MAAKIAPAAVNPQIVARLRSEVMASAEPGVGVVRARPGGALDGAESFSRETMRWQPAIISPDRAINGVKPMADARGKDMVWNDGYSRGAVSTFKDSIVGTTYRLNSLPNWRVLARTIGPAFDEVWAEEYQLACESIFNLVSESPSHWLDASRLNTFTSMVRLAVGGYVFTGEVLATAEWIREVDRPFRTAVQLVSPDRLCNPLGRMDDFYLRRGVRRNQYGRPVSYHIRSEHPGGVYANSPSVFTWSEVLATKPWGRRQVIHIFEQDQPDQSRGIAEMTSVLKQMRMTQKFGEVTLQNAVVNATYAAAIESELPSEVVAAAMGQGQNPAEGMATAFTGYLAGIAEYYKDAQGVSLDGVKIPHFFPGTKLNMKTLGTPGGVGSDFEASLLRHIAAGLNISYEELSRDFSRVNYSSARASLNKSAQGMNAKKKFVADRFAGEIYTLWLEEQINAGMLPMPAGYQGAGSGVFYQPNAKEALSACAWVGASRGQIDELKETQAAILRMSAGLSTAQDEMAKLSVDWRENYAQLAREQKVRDELGLVLSSKAERDGSASGQNTMNRETGNAEQPE